MSGVNKFIFTYIFRAEKYSAQIMLLFCSQQVFLQGGDRPKSVPTTTVDNGTPPQSY